MTARGAATGDRTPVVTGLGIISPIGLDCDSFWQALMSGRSGVRPVRSFDTAPYPTHIGCEIHEFAPPAWIETALGRAPGRATAMIVAAAQQALRQAGLAQTHDLRRAGLCAGTTMGEAGWLEAWPREQALAVAGPAAAPTPELLRAGPDQIGLDSAAALGLGGPVVTLAAACAAGNYAIGQAADLIRLGRADQVLAGGADSFSRTAFTGFARLGALAKECCRPFSRDRDGIVIAEGAAVLLVESLGSARTRGATVLAEVAGYGLSCDAHHIVSPHPEGTGAVAAMQAALRDAALDTSDIDYICAHGTGTRTNDASEVLAARKLFGARRVPMSSIKALTGHSLGAASALEAVACVLALQAQIIPPTWNYRELDPECDWDVVPNAPRPATLRAVLNTAYAFGGDNSAIVLRRAD
jgi:3-oxoacyl-[acyl-carrier-protein] synthase II